VTLHCKHCTQTFPDGHVLAFCRHLENDHHIKAPYCLGDHGRCDTPPRKVMDPLPGFEDGSALQPWRHNEHL